LSGDVPLRPALAAAGTAAARLAQAKYILCIFQTRADELIGFEFVTRVFDQQLGQRHEFSGRTPGHGE
jgi:hypothetical protein